MLHIKNINKSFGTKKVLDNFSLDVAKGTIAFLLGESGVGKSTLLRVLNNLETFDSGTISLDDKPLDIAKVNRTHTVGMVFQHFNLFDNLTIEKNIMLPLELAGTSEHEARRIAHELLAHYNLADKATTYPAQLSGGQKQRVAIARTVALQPRIICFDEPSSALDPTLTNFVAANIQELAHKGFIIIIASHDIALLEQLDCSIYLMQAGSIRETASSHELHRNPEQFPKISAFVKGI